MATGRLRYYSVAQMGQVNVTYVIPADIPPMMTEGNEHFKRPMKTLYLLHGYSGNDSDWEYNGIAEDIAAKYNMAVFMITGGNNFYLDRKATGCQYCTFAGQEVVDFTRKMFGLSTKREDTLIGGLSMGGFGALHTAFAYPETFGGVVALSSALIIYDIKGLEPGFADMMANYDYYKEVFGDLEHVDETDNNPEVLFTKNKEYLCKNMPIYMAVGTEDFLYENNQIMRRFLEKNDARLKYEEGPGIHDWVFWNNYVLKGLDYVLSEIK